MGFQVCKGQELLWITHEMETGLCFAPNVGYSLTQSDALDVVSWGWVDGFKPFVVRHSLTVFGPFRERECGSAPELGTITIGPMSATALEQCLQKMRDADISQAAIDNFRHYWQLCADGATGLIREDTIAPLLDPPQLAEVEISDADQREALSKTVIIKLNGGLGTSMGLEASKTLLPVRDGNRSPIRPGCV